MPIALQDEIRRDDLRRHPEQLYVFGGAMAPGGSAGQAQEIQDEPNAVGIPIKWAPHEGDDAFFVDGDLARVKTAIDVAIARLRNHLLDGGTVVFPRDGVGSGPAQRAPKIAEYIKAQLATLRPLARGTSRTQPQAARTEYSDIAGAGDHKCSFPGCTRRGILGRHIMRDGPVHREIETETWDCQIHDGWASTASAQATTTVAGQDPKQWRLL